VTLLSVVNGKLRYVRIYIVTYVIPKYGAGTELRKMGRV